jgi:hypothetical protein
MRKELYYFRDQQGLQVDFLVPRPNAKLWLVEAKSAKTLRPPMASPLTWLELRVARKWLPVLFRTPGAVRVSFGLATDSVLHVADLRAEALAQRLRRRTRVMIPSVDMPRKLARPSKPAPSKTTVAGSGVAIRGPPSANPVMGPQFVPDAVQKWTAKEVNWLAVKPDAVRVKLIMSALTIPCGSPLMSA